MAISEHESGTQACTVTTEHTLQTTSPNTTDGVYQFCLDVNALVAGDTLEVRVKEKIVSAGTIRVCLFAVLVGDQGADGEGWFSPTMILLHGWDFTIKQTTGTSRSVPWSIRKVA